MCSKIRRSQSISSSLVMRSTARKPFSWKKATSSADGAISNAGKGGGPNFCLDMGGARLYGG